MKIAPLVIPIFVHIQTQPDIGSEQRNVFAESENILHNK